MQVDAVVLVAYLVAVAEDAPLAGEAAVYDRLERTHSDGRLGLGPDAALAEARRGVVLRDVAASRPVRDELKRLGRLDHVLPDDARGAAVGVPDGELHALLAGLVERRREAGRAVGEGGGLVVVGLRAPSAAALELDGDAAREVKLDVVERPGYGLVGRAD